MFAPGCVALVTGASAGIGAAYARDLAARGVPTLVLVARREDRLEELATELRAAHGTDVRVRAPALTDAQALEALIEGEPRVDVLVNNAGFGWNTAFAQQTGDTGRLTRMINLNCTALVQLTAAYLPGMRDRGAGWILNVGSTAGLIPLASMAVYSGTKGFVNHFTEGLRAELRGTGVEVLLVAPGPVDTEFFAVAHPGLGRPLAFLFRSPAKVAKESLNALFRGSPRIVPGLHMLLGMGALATLPMVLLRPILNFVAKVSGKHLPNPDGQNG